MFTNDFLHIFFHKYFLTNTMFFTEFLHNHTFLTRPSAKTFASILANGSAKGESLILERNAFIEPSPSWLRAVGDFDFILNHAWFFMSSTFIRLFGCLCIMLSTKLRHWVLSVIFKIFGHKISPLMMSRWFAYDTEKLENGVKKKKKRKNKQKDEKNRKNWQFYILSFNTFKYFP